MVFFACNSSKESTPEESDNSTSEESVDTNWGDSESNFDVELPEVDRM
jgi:hypothetical protein